MICYEFLRPVDELRQIIGLNKREKIVQFFQDHGSYESGAMCLILACGDFGSEYNPSLFFPDTTNTTRDLQMQQGSDRDDMKLTEIATMTSSSALYQPSRVCTRRMKNQAT